MSKIEITADNIKKFAKRLQKHSEQFGSKYSLATSQEFLSKILGTQNYNDLLIQLSHEKQNYSDIVHKTIIPSSLLDLTSAEIKLDQLDKDYLNTSMDIKCLVELFINKLTVALHHTDSNINICSLNSKDEFFYTLNFESSFGDTYSLDFDGKIGSIVSYDPYEFEHEIKSKMIDHGLKGSDIHILLKAFAIPETENNKRHNKYSHLLKRFEAIDFGKALYESMQKRQGNKNNYYFKADLKLPKYQNVIEVNGDYFVPSTLFINNNYLDTVANYSKINDEFSQISNFEDLYRNMGNSSGSLKNAVTLKIYRDICNYNKVIIKCR